jgi:EpsI family protein
MRPNVQQKISVSYIVLTVLLIASGIVSWKVFFKEYRQQDTVNIHHFPKKVGSWVSVDLPIAEDVYAILETRNVFTRRYKNEDGRGAYLLLVYSENNRKVSHPPEICYTGSGVSILSNEPAYIEMNGLKKRIKVNRLFVEQGNTQQIMYYWFKVGDTFTANYWKQQALIVWKTLLGQRASSALLRVSVTIDEKGVPEAVETINQFSQVISPHLLEYLP